MGGIAVAEDSSSAGAFLFINWRELMEDFAVALCVVLFGFWVLMILAGAAAGVLILVDEVGKRLGGK